MKRRLKKVILLLIGLSILLTGCWDQKIFERIGFALQVGLELDSEQNLLLSITMPVVSEEIKENTEIISAKGELVREARDKLRNISGKRVEGGKIQHIHFSREIAEKGIGDLLDVFLRSPENPLLANMIVVEGSPFEMFKLSQNYQDKTRVAFYVTQLVDDAHKRTVAPETRIWNFATLCYSQTIDPTAIYMRYTDKEIEIAGSALFNGDKMVGVIDIMDTGLLQALMAEEIRFEYSFQGEKPEEEEKIKSGISILLKDVNRKVKLDTAENKPKVNILLDLKATLDEYDAKHHLNETEVQKKIEEDAAKSIKKDCMELIKYLQEVGSDPIGIAEMFRTKHNDFYKSLDWDKIYKDIIINVDVKLNIEFYGAMT